jgi:hypothetical protein
MTLRTIALNHNGQVASSRTIRFCGQALSRQFVGLEMIIEILVLAVDNRIIDGHRFSRASCTSSTVAGVMTMSPG